MCCFLYYFIVVLPHSDYDYGGYEGGYGGRPGPRGSGKGTFCWSIFSSLYLLYFRFDPFPFNFVFGIQNFLFESVRFLDDWLVDCGFMDAFQIT